MDIILVPSGCMTTHPLTPTVTLTPFVSEPGTDSLEFNFACSSMFGTKETKMEVRLRKLLPRAETNNK